MGESNLIIVKYDETQVTHNDTDPVMDESNLIIVKYDETQVTHNDTDPVMDELNLIIVEYDETQVIQKPQSASSSMYYKKHAQMKMMKTENCGDVFKFITSILATLNKAKTIASPENVTKLLTRLFIKMFKPKENPTTPAFTSDTDLSMRPSRY
ncbi:hypothetical protein V1264_007957 [Littorina saxatilis]|uniref:Uncharacterized protein n=1 Tax=Littorina saxatilis TaxID=31220 RepID=A0AAN9AWH2_9CAEN